MTDLFSFSSHEEACAKLDSLGGYVNPEKVASLKGAAAHEVAVGPVHAGVIEPGHFRFQCMGEDVFKLIPEFGKRIFFLHFRDITGMKNEGTNNLYWIRKFI